MRWIIFYPTSDRKFYSSEVFQNKKRIYLYNLLQYGMQQINKPENKLQYLRDINEFKKSWAIKSNEGFNSCLSWMLSCSYNILCAKDLMKSGIKTLLNIILSILILKIIKISND